VPGIYAIACRRRESLRTGWLFVRKPHPKRGEQALREPTRRYPRIAAPGVVGMRASL
jgi:hypothetical protein